MGVVDPVLEIFNFIRTKFLIFPKDFRFQCKIFRRTFLVVNSKHFYLSQNLPFSPTFLATVFSFFWKIISFQNILSVMGGVYQGLGGLSPPWKPDNGKIFVSRA